MTKIEQRLVVHIMFKVVRVSGVFERNFHDDLNSEDILLKKLNR